MSEILSVSVKHQNTDWKNTLKKTTTTNQIGNDSLETTRKKDEYVFKAQTRESFILKLGCFKFFVP